MDVKDNPRASRSRKSASDDVISSCTSPRRILFSKSTTGLRGESGRECYQIRVRIYKTIYHGQSAAKRGRTCEAIKGTDLKRFLRRCERPDVTSYPTADVEDPVNIGAAFRIADAVKRHPYFD